MRKKIIKFLKSLIEMRGAEHLTGKASVDIHYLKSMGYFRK